ncbi:MAG: class I SAM-dependent methyltransferase [Deltaproteobacteria bacterium]|jgi:predicted O-methyltransferase YrrM|nr:class I SAM-dependent methyltransferase [Deltaproteobacteria bacterium]
MSVPDKKTGEFFRHWRDVLSSVEKRLYYRDQSEASFQALCALAADFNPTLIVELGTHYGTSLRAWLMAAPQARVTAVDLDFSALSRSMDLFPIAPEALTRVKLLQSDIMRLDFASLWSEQDRVLLFVDAHDLPDVPIMSYVLEQAVPRLPQGSLVVVDDLWHSPELVTAANARACFRQRVLGEIDELQLFEGWYAPYHGGGSFWGFREVVPLLRYAHERGLRLEFSPEAKHVYFYTGGEIPPSSTSSPPFDAELFNGNCGSVSWHPLQDAFSVNARPRSAVLKEVTRLYAGGGYKQCLELLLDLLERKPDAPGLCYALAIVLARLGSFDQALSVLKKEMTHPRRHPGTDRLYADIKSRFFRLQCAGKKPPRPGLSLFAAPKPFAGPIGIIQRNAVKSWLRLTPRPDIMLFGDEGGIAGICEEFGLRHMPDLPRDDLGVPRLDELFLLAQAEARADILCYVNADIILFNDLLRVVTVAARKFPDFLLVGDRLDYDLREEIDFSDPLRVEKLLAHALETGVIHKPTGMDYFVFTPGLWRDIPPFALGRCKWDIWLLDNALRNGCPVVDCSPAVTIIHQNHDYAHVQGGKEAVFGDSDPSARRNRALAGSGFQILNVNFAPFRAHKDGHITRRA